MLQDSQPGHQERQNHHEPCKTSPLCQGSKRLRRQKNQDQHGQQQLQFNPRREARCGQAKYPLQQHYQRKCRQRE